MSMEDSHVGDVIGNEIVIDYANEFTISILFNTPKELKSWVIFKPK